jgi:hypothetical protein
MRAVFALPIERVVNCHPEEFAFRVKPIGPKVPANPHLSRNGIASEASFRVNNAPKSFIPATSASRIAPAGHTNGCELRVVNEKLDLSSLAMSLHLSLDVQCIPSGPADPLTGQDRRQPNRLDVDAAGR